jgi:hypothetical protein
MTEPASSTTSLTALGIALFGPLFGEYAVILLAALAGGLLPLSSRPTESRLRGALFLLRVVLTSFIFTGLVVALVEQHTGLSVRLTLAPVAFVLAAIGDRWRELIDAVAERIKALISRGAKPGNGDPQ